MKIHLAQLVFCKTSRTKRSLDRIVDKYDWESKTLVDLSYPLPSRGLNHRNLLKISRIYGFNLCQIDNIGQTANMQFTAKTLLSSVPGSDWILFWDQDNLLSPDNWIDSFIDIASRHRDAGYITCKTSIEEHFLHQQDIGDETCRLATWAGGWPIGLIRADVCRALVGKMIYGSTEWDCLEACLSLGLRAYMSSCVTDLRCDLEQDLEYQQWKAYSIGRKDALGFTDWLVRRI